MNLNIPLISPKVEITETSETEVSCCSKKGTDECVSRKKVKKKE